MRKLLAIGLTLLISISVMFAQTVTPNLDKTQKRQRARTHQGVKSGELTKREARSLTKQQIHIRKDERRAKADGVETPKERKHIKNDQKRANKNIAAKKHNRYERRK